MKEKKVDKIFLILVFILISIGLAMFVSASFGLLARNENNFYSVLHSQLILGLGGGLIGMYFALKIPYKFWAKYAFYIFLVSILLTAAVFIPYVGISHLGAKRWISLGFMSFQPVEFLKFAFVLYFAAWLSWSKNKTQDFRFRIIPLAVMLGIIGLILYFQPDTKSFILIAITGFAMLFISGLSWKKIVVFCMIVVLSLGVLVSFKPYLQARVKTFINPASDPRGSSYQIQQSLIALGSGGVWGRGYGQSIQKFSYLPEPQGDSIFAVLGEEFGFVGAITTIILYLFFILRGFHIANNSPDSFSRLLVFGIVILIGAQSFMHMASVVGVFPLTGVPLVFMSHGGTSLMISLIAVGVILQISKLQHKSVAL